MPWRSTSVVVYIVYVEEGEYDDWSMWVEGVYAKALEAMKHRDHINKTSSTRLATVEEENVRQNFRS